MTMTETQRRRRGHAFLPPKDVLRRIPAIYATENTPAADKTVWVHYFAASGDWYLTELDQETGEAYGYVKLAAYPEGAEWGYFDLGELEQVSVFNGLVIVERDMHWTPVKFSEVK